MTDNISNITNEHKCNYDLLRLFIAIPIPDEIKARVDGLAGRLRTGFQFGGCRLIWSATETMHLTLRFLGATPPEQIEPLIAAIAPISGRYSPLEMKLGDIGVFPHWRSPRVLWVGVSDKAGQIMELQREIEAAVAALGFKPAGNEFHAHLTLARFKSPRGAQAAREVVASHRNFKTERFIAAETALFKSEPSPAGVKHSVVKKFPFAKNRTEAPANEEC